MKNKSSVPITLNFFDSYDIKECETLIGIPTDEWEGNCHSIASAIVESGIIDGVVERGYWKGKV